MSVPCPECQSAESTVIDSRMIEGSTVVRRRRVCDGRLPDGEPCGNRYTTYERYASHEPEPPVCSLCERPYQDEPKTE